MRPVNSLCLSFLKIRLSFLSMLSAITVSAGCCQGKEEKLRVGRGYTVQWHSSRLVAESTRISASSREIVRSVHLADGSLRVIERMGLSKLRQANSQMWGGTVAPRFIIFHHFQKGKLSQKHFTLKCLYQSQQAPYTLHVSLTSANTYIFNAKQHVKPVFVVLYTVLKV